MYVCMYVSRSLQGRVQGSHQVRVAASSGCKHDDGNDDGNDDGSDDGSDDDDDYDE